MPRKPKKDKYLQAAEQEVEALLLDRDSSPQNHSDENQSGQEVAPKHNVGRNGGRLNPGGTKGNKGGGDFSSKARQIRIAETAKRFLDKAPSVASDPTHKDFGKVGMWATEMLEGKPKQAIEGGDKPMELVIRVVKE